MLGRFLDFLNPNDWRYFAQAGLESEGESRMLSARIKKTFEWHRSQNKIGGGMVGFPYLRNRAGYVEPNPETWQSAIECIKIIIACSGTNVAAFREVKKLGIDRSRAWLSNWIRSPLIRGHSPINTCTRNRKKKQRSDYDLFLNSHPSLFSDPQLVGAEVIIDRIIADAKRYKGRVGKNQPVQALSGLLFCGRCGSTCYIRLSGSPRYPTKDRRYITCSQRILKASNCGSDIEYGAFNGTRKIINTLYSKVEDVVILALTRRSAELVGQSLIAAPVVVKESAEIAELKAQVARLVGLNDPDLIDSIHKKSTRLKRLLAQDASPSVSVQTQALFISVFSDIDTFKQLSQSQQRLIYQDWVTKVLVDRDRIDVLLSI